MIKGNILYYDSHYFPLVKFFLKNQLKRVLKDWIKGGEGLQKPLKNIF